MVEPERVLHSVMVIAFERKGDIDPGLKIIGAVQSDLDLDEEHATDALDHIRQYRGDGDWSGKRDKIVGTAISRIEEAIDSGMLSNSGIKAALKKLISATVVESEDDDPFDALEDDMPGMALEDSILGVSDDGDETMVFEADNGQMLGDDDDLDPFEVLGGRPLAAADEDSNSNIIDPLQALMEEDDEESEAEGTFLFAEEKNVESEKQNEEAPDEASIVDMYRMMLDTVWVDDIIDPSEVKLLARKREELGISFETHLKMVREMLEE